MRSFDQREDDAVESARAERDFEETRDHGQPSPWAHARYLERARREFTAQERRMIRYSLGLLSESQP